MLLSATGEADISVPSARSKTPLPIFDLSFAMLILSAAHRAAGELYDAVLLKHIVPQVNVQKRFAHGAACKAVRYYLYRFGRLNGSDKRCGGAEYTMRAGYRICAALRCFAGHQTGKARSARHDIHRHALTLHNSAVYPRNTARYAAAVNYFACLKIVACVNDDIGAAEQSRGIVLREPFARRCDRNIAVYFSEMLAGCIGLAAPDIALIKKRLTLKIAQLDDIIVDDEYMPDSGACKVGF